MKVADLSKNRLFFAQSLGMLGCGPTGLIGMMRLMVTGLLGLDGVGDLLGDLACARVLALNAASSASTTFNIRRMSLAASFPMFLFSQDRVHVSENPQDRDFGMRKIYAAHFSRAHLPFPNRLSMRSTYYVKMEICLGFTHSKQI